MGSEKSIVEKQKNRRVHRAYTFGQRQYEFVASFLKKRMAAQFQRKLEKNGYMAKIKEYPGIWAVYKAMVRSL